MTPVNPQLVAAFRRMADVMQILGVDSFRVNAFAKVARVLEELPTDLCDIGPDEKKLQEIDGVGKGMAARIAEFFRTGKMAEHDELMAKVPPTLLELLSVPGLGPKTIALLWKTCGVTGLEDLRLKLDAGQITGVPGLGEKKLDNLKKSLAFATSTAAAARARIGEALPLAEYFVAEVSRMPGVVEARHAGSLRRGKETVGDVDIIAAVEPISAAKEVMARFVKLDPVSDVLGQGPTKSSVRTFGVGAMQVDLRVVEPAQFGAALLYFTGSKEHNVRLRQRAIDRGMKLSEYGLFKADTDEVVASATEEDVYRALGLGYIPPELREDRGEMDLAAKGALPVLVTRQDIAAELHAHTTASDGVWSIRELALAAAARGFHTVAVTDHSKSQTLARGLTEERLLRHARDVRAVAEELKDTIRVLAGTECDILADGRLDYSDEVLRELDIVVASPHAALTQEPDKATDRLLRAIENRYVTIIGHPTGRLVNRRPGLSPDMEKVIAAAKARGVALEINANYHRLDLRDQHARMAIEAGAKLAINTDAHGPPDLDQLPFGVLTARRAGATKNDVVNCMSRDALRQWIAATRG